VTSFIRVEDHGSVRLLVMDRPEAKNALHAPMRTQLIEQLQHADNDPDVSAVVLTGAGGVFSAGVDFKIHDHPPAAEAQFLLNPASALRAMRTPVVAAVNGACVSGGLEIALSCTFMVASSSARFADTHARLGVVATWGLTALLPRTVGPRRAARMSLTGEFVGAEDALAAGLVTEVLPDEKLLDHALALASRIPGNGAASELLDLYRQGESLGLAQALEAETQASLVRTVDLDEFTRRAQT
jgi:enoyl-CoA hydratase